jgi:glycerol kinase
MLRAYRLASHVTATTSSAIGVIPRAIAPLTAAQRQTIMASPSSALSSSSSNRNASSSSSSSRKYIGALDQGTSSTRFLLYDVETMKMVSSHQLPVSRITPHPGWVQMDPLEIYNTSHECIRHVMSTPLPNAQGNITKEQVVGIGITNQRETLVAWDRQTGAPLHDAIVWLDLRTKDTVASLVKQFGSIDSLRPICGLPLSTYFSGVKLKWLFDNVPAIPNAWVCPLLFLSCSWLIKPTNHLNDDVSVYY